MDQQKPSSVPTVLSVISLVISALGFICAVILLLISVFGREGGSATALTKNAVMFVSGMVFFTAFAWIFAILGGFAGFFMMIVDVAVKRTNILLMPITSVILGIISIVMSIFAF